MSAKSLQEVEIFLALFRNQENGNIPWWPVLALASQKKTGYTFEMCTLFRDSLRPAAAGRR